jgi:hypothetical protein
MQVLAMNLLSARKIATNEEAGLVVTAVRREIMMSSSYSLCLIQPDACATASLPSANDDREAAAEISRNHTSPSLSSGTSR